MIEDYFSLQLRFAAHHAMVAHLPFDRSIAYCTNLRRRLNLWGPTGANRWNDFLARAGNHTYDCSNALSVCMEFHETRPCLSADRVFGCFSCDPPDVGGVLRIHFVPPEDTRESPLASGNIDDRMNELQELFLHVRRTERNVSSVRGVSWLYNLDAYKRLFPPTYAASVRPVSFPLHLNGSSTWGQVLNWRQEVKPAVRDTVLARLPTMDIDAPWKTFPQQALTATSDVADFYEMFT